MQVQFDHQYALPWGTARSEGRPADARPLYSQHRHYYNKMRDLYEKFEKEQDLFTSIEELKKSVPVAPGLTNREIQFDNSAYDAVISELINLSDK